MSTFINGGVFIPSNSNSIAISMSTMAILKRFLRHFSCATMLLFLVPHSGWSEEPVHTFGDLRSRVRSGDKVLVVDKQGQKTQGRIAGLSAASLDLTVNGTVWSFPESGVQKITHQHHASLLKGAVFGALAGGFTFMAICEMKNNSDAGRCTVDPAAVFAASAGVGALSGMGVAMMIRRPESIFESTERVKIKAVSTFNRSRKAVALAILF
jgi:hypothetical protein